MFTSATKYNKRQDDTTNEASVISRFQAHKGFFLCEPFRFVMFPFEIPVVNADGTVTISIFAPKAVKVEITGDFLPVRKVESPHRNFF